MATIKETTIKENIVRGGLNLIQVKLNTLEGIEEDKRSLLNLELQKNKYILVFGI